VAIDGLVARGFEPVQAAFERNFERRAETGAACAVTVGGELVVDLWGGVRDASRNEPWERDTLVLMFSTTKGIASIALAHAHARGLFDHGEPVARYWPEFGSNGKHSVTVRQLLSHQAGLCAIDEKMDLAALSDPDWVAAVIAAQAPAWEPGTRHGYHGLTLGWYESELLRRVDPKRRTIGRYFADEVAAPLGLEFYIGLPEDVPADRIAVIGGGWYRTRMLMHLGSLPTGFVKGFLDPRSITARTFSNPKILGMPNRYNDRSMRRIELPAANGIGTVRSVAIAYGELATGGRRLGLGSPTLRALSEPASPPSQGRFDEVLRTETTFSLGYCKPWPGFEFGSARAFGTPGAGGSFGFAEPELGLGFGYAMNRMGFHLWNDPRERALREAALACARRA
jgi:CubicO group peptidase (beta-lactamase class C family)